jgi:hypothetical protein
MNKGAAQRTEMAVLRSIRKQDRQELGGALSVLSLQRRDHVQLDRYLRELAGTVETEQGPVLLAIYRLVFSHAFAEEAVLWPVIRRVLPDGHELTLRVECEHQAINGLLTLLERLPPGSAGRQTVLDQVVELLGEDVRDEEDELLPKLLAKLSSLELKLLGLAWEVVRRIAPTRPHPLVSRRPPGNVLSALPLSLLDRSRDRVDALRFRQVHTPSALTRASDALARASHAIERLPGFGAGEDPQTKVAVQRRPKAGFLALAAGMVASGTLVFIVRRRTAAVDA